MSDQKVPYGFDRSGEVFGRWTVLRRAGAGMWRCRCSCGTEKFIQVTTLVRGTSKSCGCYSADLHRKHGMEGTSTYNAWAHMLARCRNPKTQSYERWGGRGIKVCKEWHAFEAFFADMGKKPKNKSLDRIDNDGNYEPGNCRWATQRTQSGNQEKSLRYEWNGQTRTLSDLAHEHGMQRRRVYQRLLAGWTLKDALTIKRANAWSRGLR